MHISTVKTGIIGISGYSGLSVLEILLAHPHARLTYAGAQSTTGRVSEIWPQLKGRTSLVCEKLNIAKAASNCDLVFLAVPHTTSMQITPQLLKHKVKIIDLSGDYRLKRATQYKKWYKTEHTDKARLSKAVYGLPELYREKIRKANLIANPGCYPTAALLGLAPLAALQPADIRSIVIDAKSGTTGAGKKVTEAMMFSSVHDNFKAYRVLQHQHSPEIEQYLAQVAGRDLDVNFVAHLLPLRRGILATIYVHTDQTFSARRLQAMYKKFYKTEPFVRVLEPGEQPELKNVAGTNFCDIALTVNEKKNVVVITSAIDNLLKGAGGQAVQNMNIMCGFPEGTALKG